MHDDTLIDAHKEWLGYVQPIGVLVAPAALVHRGIIPDRHVAPLQERLDAATRASSDAEPLVSDFAEFATSLLGWEHRDLAGAPGGPPLPDDLIVNLIEYNDRLAPTYAVPGAGDGADTWQMLIRVEATGIDLDQTPHDDGRHWAVSPHSRFERLLRETDIATGLITNGKSFRLVYAPKGETSGFATFDLEPMLEVAGRPMLSAFHMLLKVERLFGAPEQNLPALLAESRDYQETVSKELAEQVLVAMNELLRGFHAADIRTQRTTTTDLVKADPDHLYSGLLTALLRTVFILYAEDRGLFPRDEIWERNYSLGGLFERLRDDAALYPDTMDDRYGAWAQLLVLWRLVYSGGRHAHLRLVAKRGRLFDPSRFLFLEGRTLNEEAIEIPVISDGVLWRVLSALMVLNGERLSYRTLDVEQLGSVYQSIMGFTIDVTTGPSVAIRPQTKGGASATIDLDFLLNQEPAKRPEWVRLRTDRKLTNKIASSVQSAKTASDLESALSPCVDSQITPKPLPKGVPVLQPTEARRSTGSHYTPRRLTSPIVAETLRPIFERLGDYASAEDILTLRILDPALGSGAFLVEACRQLADRLRAAWECHGSAPNLAPDQDAIVHSRRLIAQRCLYGVDRNPMAVDLAKLSLWLVTFSSDHEFTFLDHAIRHGDSLVGLSLKQIEGLSWNVDDELPLISSLVQEQIRVALARREEINTAPDGASEASQQLLLAAATASISDLKAIGDAVMSAFFASDKPRERERTRQRLVSLFSLGERDLGENLRSALYEFHAERSPIVSFHWELEFPEVFTTEAAGFDAIVGNPPYMGGVKISTTFGKPYFDWLLTINAGSKNRCDLVAHFFRRCFDLLRDGGCFGLVATKTIAEGDTRESGLQCIVRKEGQIYAAKRRLRWPGEATVIVSVIHVAKSPTRAMCTLDGRAVDFISCYLVEGSMNDTPFRLCQPLYCSVGSLVYGRGFLFDDDDPRASPLSLMRALLADNPSIRNRIRPFIGGEEINSEANPEPSRYAIYLSDLRKEEELNAVPELARIVREKVKPERERLGNDPNAQTLKKKWWAYQAHRPELYQRLSGRDRVLCHSRVSKHLGFTFLPTGYIYGDSLVAFDTDQFCDFGLLQSRIHELWVRFFCSSLGGTLRYSPSDVFETFPFPASYMGVERAAAEYFEHRSAMMLSANEGLTNVYNRFNDPSNTEPAVETLRELHAELDHAVLECYGWTDAKADATFDADSNDENQEEHVRYTWPAEVRDLVFGRLLELNADKARRGTEC